MKPKELKIIADGMGYKVRLTELFEPVTASGELCLKGTQVRYNPLTNDTQCMEIIVKCGISVSVDSTGDGRQVTVWDSDIYFYELYEGANNDPGFNEKEAAMIKRLVCKAALEDFSNKLTQEKTSEQK